MPERTITVMELGIDEVHEDGFFLNMPEQFPHYTLSYYGCPVKLLDCKGYRDWGPGVILLNRPDDHRYVEVKNATFVSSWFHISGAGVDDCLERYCVPTNLAMDLGELHFLNPILKDIRRERLRQAPFWNDAVSDLVRRLFRELGFVIAEVENATARTGVRSKRALRDVRMHVHTHLSEHWTVEAMAEMAEYHPTWFASVYKKQFGVSPLNDLLDARMKYAEELLRRQPLSIQQVATQCGFTSQEHFTRMYRKRMGYPPGQSRKLSN